MSHRVVPSLRVHLLLGRLLLTRAYHTPTPASHCTSPRRPVRNPRSLVVVQARSITHSEYGKKLGKKVRSDSGLDISEEVPPLIALKVCEEFGFTNKQSLALWTALWYQLRQSFAPFHSYAWLHSYTSSKPIPANVPTPRNRTEKEERMDNRDKERAALVGQHDPENTSRALNVLGFYLIKAAFDAHRESLKRAKPQLHQAFFMFEIAVHYKSLESAVWLLKLAADPTVQRLGETPNTTHAKGLVYRTVEADPRRCTWQALCTYMEDASSLHELKKQTPKQRALAIQDLQHAGADILPGQAAATLDTFEVFANPWTLLLRLVEHCLDYSLPVHAYTPEHLEELRLKCLRHLADYNDPTACFIIATREREFGSEDWVRMMTCAATEAQRDAAWLLAIHHWREDGLLAICNRPTQKEDRMSADEKARLQSTISKKMESQATQNPGFEWAQIALLHHHQGRPYVLNDRAVATAALFRTLISREAGETVLHNLLEKTEDKAWYTDRARRTMEEVLRDYTAEDDPHNLWELESCLSQIKKITDRSPQSTRAMGVIAEHLPYSPEPPELSKRVSRSYTKLLRFWGLGLKP